ncbi:hypothetical protein [Paenibacillus soyae]|uniref:Uncharacterized protein n=1 Tax=Paenibacillus soyae TaxID=2969249 RepID=A0A9X2MNV0_9BACL|nr:hypothetical protein [Paenibacillus soyae]MCR2804174.1 hypothetical protein [Paenibacillus soyae]
MMMVDGWRNNGDSTAIYRATFQHDEIAAIVPLICLISRSSGEIGKNKGKMSVISNQQLKFLKIEVLSPLFMLKRTSEACHERIVL